MATVKIGGVMRKFLLLFALILYSGVSVFSQSMGITRFVSVKNAIVKDTPWFFARDLGNLPLGNEVTLISESGKWSRISSGNLTGWVTSASLSVRRIVASGTSSTATEIALAGKGFSPETEMDYRQNGLNYSMVDYMEQITVPKDELLGFINDGRLSRGD
jgi:SH3-like domain-containing protein